MKIKKIAWSVTESEYFSYTPLYQATVLKEVCVERGVVVQALPNKEKEAV